MVLVEPEIPPNTGNVGRLCAATRCRLHLVGPLGFSLDDKHLRRAGLDYWPHVDYRAYRDWTAFESEGGLAGGRAFFFSARASRSYLEVSYRPGDWLVFGKESSGLPPALLERNRERVFRIPVLTERVRSLNLANAVAIVVYEALRQTVLAR
ncbi:MAG: tRNA (cytidine(34)-2'-O)-methyltransferase [Candidatus Binatia bacterium]|nr:MAG: tRNA (cytidine(34)-2'-O)-methyltransferase [Candidatus Binatia bacterium]